MTEKEIEVEIEKFINDASFPTNEEINNLGDSYESYVNEYSNIPDPKARNHFMLGMIFMAKKWNKSLDQWKPAIK